MPIIAQKLQQQMEIRIYNGLKAAFAKDGKDSPEANANWEKTAKAVAAIAQDICLMLLTEAQVAPGIASAGSGGGVPGPVATVSTSPGKLI